MKDFLTQLIEDGILADGALGTEIYKHGIFINRCFDELNLSNPSLIKEIHLDYIKAGSGLIETNTFTANRPALAAHGFSDKVFDINVAGAKIAKEVAGDSVFVAGSVGPISWTKKDAGTMERAEMEEIFSEQISALVAGGVDVLLLETFTHLEELHVAYSSARKICDLPIIAQVSLKYLGEGEFEGLLPEYAAIAIDHWGADVLGVNCCDGPQGVFEAVKRMVEVTSKPVSAMPNAGLPQMIQGRLLYLASPEYMAEYARRYAKLGVALIGGCCGTTPAHIREMKKFLKSMKPRARLSSTVLRENVEVKVGLVPSSQKKLVWRGPRKEVRYFSGGRSAAWHKSRKGDRRSNASSGSWRGRCKHSRWSKGHGPHESNSTCCPHKGKSWYRNHRALLLPRQKSPRPTDGSYRGGRAWP
jgi:homocysteine S-methyltransferase